MFINSNQVLERMREATGKEAELIGGMVNYLYLIFNQDGSIHGACGLPCLVVGARPGSNVDSDDFVVDLAFETPVPDNFVVKENLKVTHLVPEILPTPENGLRIDLCDFDNRFKIIELVNECADARQEASMPVRHLKLVQ